jgi:hypothetical protein
VPRRFALFDGASVTVGVTCSTTARSAAPETLDL